ncbi:MAG: glycoside hydrolase family 32 protein [Planctomycetaceae bacterium]|jgi:fructan beta-fructosidase|nr:glycoside hydrolase family 32 protein [Planctomycetaceae bacterium]
MQTLFRLTIVLLVSFSFAVSVTAADILIADFEGGVYASGWKVEGTAFGNAPAHGTLKGQMKVTGFLGNGLVNSFSGGDGSTGKLTSPNFKIERPFISFLIGGGGHKGLAINLIVEGKTARTATGSNIVPGGNENLSWFDWNVTEFQGKEGHVEIIDEIGGSWGHINVDHLVQTDHPKMPVEKRIDFVAVKEFLHLPVTMNAPTTWIRVEVDGIWQQEFECSLTVDGTPDFYADLQIGQWKEKKVTLIAEKVPRESQGLDLLRQDDKRTQEETVYTEPLRPQFHFTARTGWINDPNGLLHYDGVWHLFFQHNPYGTHWGNMTWGHATSSDLLHWTEHPAAIHPDQLGTIFSGSGVVDWNNSSGFQKGNAKPLVLIYSASGGNARFGAKMTQCLVYSTDAGKTFQKWEHNPVLPHIVGGNRDPKVIRHEPSKQWIMALYMEKENYALFASKDLKQWEKLGDINDLGCTECPDFFPLPVDGNAADMKWVFWGADGKYLLGSFDGKEWKRDKETRTTPLTNKYGGNDYAAMTFSDAPDGRRIQLSWMQGGHYPGMPFNQQYTVPRELTLRTTPQGVRLFTEPVRELELLHGELKEFRNLVVTPQKETLIAFEETIFDAEMVLDVAKADKLAIDVVGQRIEYKVADQQISLEGIDAPLPLQDGKLKLRIVVDRTSIELFAQNGEVQIAKCFVPKSNVTYKGITVSGEVVVEYAKFWKMNSVWKIDKTVK